MNPRAAERRVIDAFTESGFEFPEVWSLVSMEDIRRNGERLTGADRGELFGRVLDARFEDSENSKLCVRFNSDESGGEYCGRGALGGESLFESECYEEATIGSALPGECEKLGSLEAFSTSSGQVVERIREARRSEGDDQAWVPFTSMSARELLDWLSVELADIDYETRFRLAITDPVLSPSFYDVTVSAECLDATHVGDRWPSGREPCQ